MVRLIPTSRKTIAQAIIDSRKLEWLRRYVPGLPDIYDIPDFTPNGCGASNWHCPIIRMALNEWFLPEFVEAAGDLHDYLYWIGGTELDRANDDLILHNLLLASAPWGWTPHALYHWLTMHGPWGRANEYYFAVLKFGAAHFNYRASGKD